jgi:hypothetical protein
MTGSQAESFLGVPEAELRAIGCLTVAAARLEWTIRTIAADLQISPGRQQAGDLLKEIRRVTARGLPRHARVEEPAVLLEWTHDARDALNQRHVPSHSAAVYQGSAPVLLHLRSGAIAPMAAAALMESADKIVSVYVRGNDLDLALRHNPRPGVFLPNAVLDGAWIPTCSTAHGGIDMARPTQEELDEWWRTYGPFPSI